MGTSGRTGQKRQGRRREPVGRSSGGTRHHPLGHTKGAHEAPRHEPGHTRGRTGQTWFNGTRISHGQDGSQRYNQPRYHDARAEYGDRCKASRDHHARAECGDRCNEPGGTNCRAECRHRCNYSRDHHARAECRHRCNYSRDHHARAECGDRCNEPGGTNCRAARGETYERPKNQKACDGQALRGRTAVTKGAHAKRPASGPATVRPTKVQGSSAPLRVSRARLRHARRRPQPRR